MKLRIHEIKDVGTIDTKVSIPPDRLSLDLPPDHPVLLGPVEARIRAQAFEEEVMALVEVQAKIRLTCSRCLENYETMLPARFEMHVPLSEMLLDILEDARQSLVLALPAKPLCRPGCRGLCSHCGRSLNQGSCACREDVQETPFLKLKDFQF